MGMLDFNKNRARCAYSIKPVSLESCDCYMLVITMYVLNKNIKNENVIWIRLFVMKKARF